MFGELRPTVKTVFAGEGELGVGELGSGLLKKILGLFPVLLQVGASRERLVWSPPWSG